MLLAESDTTWPNLAKIFTINETQSGDLFRPIHERRNRSTKKLNKQNTVSVISQSKIHSQN